MANSPAQTRFATVKTVLSTAASVVGSAMVARTLTHDFLPPEFSDYFFSWLRNFFTRFSSDLTIVIDEFDGLINNQIFEAAESYLGARIPANTRRLKVTKQQKEKKFVVEMARDEVIVDVYHDVKLRWVLISKQVQSKHFYNPADLSSMRRSDVRSYELSFDKRYKDLVLHSYLPYIVKEATTLKEESKTVKIFTVDHERMFSNSGDVWTGVNLDHPATFDTLALETELKNKILNDLQIFVNRREHYRKVGKAWKRGYLLYGPPGTGKSTLIAAIANYLNFDVYDLELTEVRCNSELRKLLVMTANRSILVVEDIDCSIELPDRLARPGNAPQYGDKQVTLSGLLNFIDGLWSGRGDERIVVFTTNYKDKLDPALLRPGRMDVHIHLSYCSFCGFRLLASNYLDIKEHSLFRDIEDLIKTAEVTPAEVAEELLMGGEAETVLKELIEFLKEKAKLKKGAISKKIERESSVGEKVLIVHENVERQEDNNDE